MSLDTSGATGTFDGTDTLGDAFYPVFRLVFNDGGDFVDSIDKKLGEARMPDTVELYISRAMAIGILCGVGLWILGTFFGYVLFATGIIPVGPLLGAPMPSESILAFVEVARVPFLILVTGVFFGMIGFVAGFGTLIGIPYLRAGERKREINMLLPDAVAFMYALSVGGLNQLEILESMAKADDTYGEVANEFQSIVQETTYFDTDYRTAIRNQALETPSDELGQFLTDMLSIINSGGNLTSFLSDKKDKHMRTAKQEQELTLETLELFGEMYMTLSLFPLLLIIVLVIMSMLGEASAFMLYVTVYALIPLIGVGFLVLVSTVKQDEVGDGYLEPEDASDRLALSDQSSLTNLGLIERFVGEYQLFDRIKRHEGTYVTLNMLKKPHLFFRDNPLYTLALTIPTTIVLIAIAVRSGSAPTSFDGFIASPVWSTFVWLYVPLYLIGTPLAIFHEWNTYSRYTVIGKLSDNLRKLSSANDTGLTLLEAIKTVSESSSGKLSTEFGMMYAKVNYGMSLKEALIEFNNKYHIPRLARTVKLISKAQEASSQITAVLTTAAQASENQDDIDRERKSRTRMQVVIIIMTYLTLLAVMAILKTQFLDVMAGMGTDTPDADPTGGGAADFGAGLDVGMLSLLFFHAVTIQAVLSGLISGYMRDANLLSGMKYVVILMTIALVVWIAVG